MNKEELLNIISHFFEIFNKHASIKLKQFINNQDPELLYSVQQLDNIERFMHRWYKYLHVNYNKSNQQTTSRHGFVYNFDPFEMNSILLKSIEDPQFKADLEILRNISWIPDAILPFNLDNIKFIHFIRQIILDLFSISPTVISINDLNEWNFILTKDHLHFISNKLDYVLGDFVEIEILYFIFGIKITNVPKFLDIDLEIHINEIKPEDISDLTKIFKIQCSYEDRSQYLENLSSLNYIASRKIKFNKQLMAKENRQEIKKKIYSNNIYLANHFEQGFNLLGCRNTRIVAYSSPNPYDYPHFELTFNSDFFNVHFSTHSSTLWDFSKLPSFFNTDQLNWTKNVGIFLRDFPKKLLHLPQLSLRSNIFHRHRRLQSASFVYDIIMESMIILDALLTEGTQQLGYQIRMKTPWLLSQNPLNRLKWKEIVNLLYTMRSKIVHETGTSLKNQLKKFGSYQEISKYCIEIVQAILLQIVMIKENEIIFKDIKKLRNDLENAGLGISDGIKDSYLFQQFSKPKLDNLIRNFH